MHKYNNLLGIITGNLDMLLERLPKDEHVRRRYHAAPNTCLRARELTGSLQAVARRLHVAPGADDELAPAGYALMSKPYRKSGLAKAFAGEHQPEPGLLA